MTELQRTVALRVARSQLKADKSDGWYRAASNGERVTLASLYRAGILIRRPHRGKDGEADAAYEYQLAPSVVETFRNSMSITATVEATINATTVTIDEEERLTVLDALADLAEQLRGIREPVATEDAERVRALMGKFMPKGPRTVDGVELWPHFNHDHRRIDWVSIPESES